MSLDIQQSYDNIERILLYGFLTAGVSLKDNHFLLKNITDKEYANLDLYRATDNKMADILYGISFCTAFINNNNFLEDRFSKIQELSQFYLGLPVTFVVKIKNTIEKLNEIYLESIRFLEGFCYTDRSRYLWRVFDINNRSKYLGIPGLDSVGMNAVQENWIVINKRLDDEDVYERELNFALLVASSMNPKGSKTLSKNYDAHKRELDELRQEIAKYGYDRKRVEEQRKKSEWAVPLQSREDLVRELYRQMSGQKDKHDLFIEEWVRKQKAAADEAKKKVEERQKEFRVKLQDVDLSRIEESRPVSKMEINKILGQKKKDFSVSSPMIPVNEHEGKELFIKKIGSTVIRSDKKE